MEQNFQTELDQWEKAFYDRNMRRMYKISKNYRDPRKKALEDYRHRRNTKWIYSHECKFVRRETNIH